MRRLLFGLFILFFASGCALQQASKSRSSEPTAEPTPLQEMRLADVGLADWPAGDALEFGDGPEAPDSVDKELVEELTRKAQAWAAAAVHDPDEALKLQPADQRLMSANVFADDVQILDTRVKTLQSASLDDGMVKVAVQTVAAYEVRTGVDDTVRVIGVRRVTGYTARPDGSGAPGTISGWQEFGADDCALVLDDVLTPGGDIDDQSADVIAFAEFEAKDAVDMPDLGEDDITDEAFVKGCEDGRA